MNGIASEKVPQFGRRRGRLHVEKCVERDAIFIIIGLPLAKEPAIRLGTRGYVAEPLAAALPRRHVEQQLIQAGIRRNDLVAIEGETDRPIAQGGTNTLDVRHY